MKQFCPLCVIFLLAAILLPGCSMLTAQGRREHAYERYVQKSSLGRAKQQNRFAAQDNTLPIIPMNDPVQAFAQMPSGDVSGPQAVGDQQ
ncbi:MAG: hypothetical protein ACR2G0_12250 [Chthoniobacterales bacterium]